LQFDNKNDTHQGVDIMRLRTLIIVGGLIGLVIIGAVAWYLISPLFIDKTIDEAFPFEVPSQEGLAQMTEAEKTGMEASFAEAIPSEAELSQMSEPQRQAVATKVMDAALAIPDHEMNEPMPAATTPVEVSPTETQETAEQAATTQPPDEQATETPTAEPEPAQPVVQLNRLMSKPRRLQLPNPSPLNPSSFCRVSSRTPIAFTRVPDQPPSTNWPMAAWSCALKISR
jgi:FtsZ-interacting cell division protein ZipA